MSNNRMNMGERRERADRRDDLERRHVSRRISMSGVGIEMRQNLERRLGVRRDGIRRLFPDRRDMDSGSFGASYF